MSLHVRLAEPSDVEAVLAVDAIARHEPARVRFLDTAIGAGECWLAESAAYGVIGFVVLQYSFYGNGFVPLIIVKESNRRQGVGRLLLQHAVSQCTTSKLFTSTNESNAAMRLLLADAGFESSGVIYNLDPGDAELVYVFRRPQ